MDGIGFSDLAALLRDEGDRILNSTAKFILTGGTLKEIINSFSLINEQKEVMTSSFQVVHNTNEKADVFSDVQFLFDFFQKSPSLKISDNYCSNESVNVGYFKRLTYLELVQIPLKKVAGLQKLRGCLETMVCMKNITEIKDVLEQCGADDCEGFIWKELRAIYFAHNFIHSIDHSFQFTPFIHTLDLSFNALSDVDQLSCLPNLKHLNVAYNKLKQAPSFTGTICNKLQVFNMKYNFIEDIAGLSNLLNLRDLNLSHNLILKHETLVPLANILALQSLKLNGNPISYHPHHRIHTCQYLHSNTATVSFSLDERILSHKERNVAGSIHPKTRQPRHHLASQSSTASSAIVEKQRRVREVTISDQYDAVEELNESMHSVSSLITSQEHLEKKKNLEKLREKLGEKWLLGDSSVGEIYGTPKKSPQFSSTPYDVDFLIHATDIVEAKETFQDIVVEVPSNEDLDQTLVHRSNSSSNTLTEVDPYVDGNISDASSDSLINIGTCDDDLYLVTRVGDADQIFLVVTENFLAERDVVTDAKEHYRWDTEGLVSCKLVDEQVHLEFDRLRVDCKQRQYIVEDADERQRLVSVLTGYIEKRPVNDGVSYQCLKCNQRFELEAGKYRRNEDVQCPICKSSLVIEEQKTAVENN